MKNSQPPPIDLAGKTCQYNMPDSPERYGHDTLCGKPATYIYESKTGAYFLCEEHRQTISDVNVGGCMRE